MPDSAKRRVGHMANVIAEKTREATEDAMDAAAEKGRLAAEGAQDVMEAIQEKSRELKLRRYRPVFPEEYFSEDYDRPKMIIIADEDERKGVEVCEGAIGWLSDDDDLEVLHLYECAVELSGLMFYPHPACDSAYFVDPFDSRRYLNLEGFFDILHQDQVTELRSIAHALGARECRLESYAKTVERRTRGLVARGEAGKGKSKTKLKAEAEGEAEQQREMSLEFHQTFEEVGEPRIPQLRWFEGDHEIAFLIRTRCGEGGGKTSHYSFSVSNSASSLISGKLAAKIDGVLSKCKLSASASMEERVETEMQRRMQFTVDF